jgi:hypothetical protein
MIELEAQIKLMAYLDGELPEREVVEIREWLARDEEARALLAELQNTGAALAGHEAGLKLPETREFFWSRIQREIARQEKAPAAAETMSPWQWVRQHLLPVGGVALLTCLLALMIVRPGRTGSLYGELEMASDDMGAYTYRDHQQKMTMVWFYDRGNDSEFTDRASLATMDPE